MSRIYLNIEEVSIKIIEVGRKGIVFSLFHRSEKGVSSLLMTIFFHHYNSG